MAWVKYDDQFPQHPKVMDLGYYAPVAGWMHLNAVCYCNAKLTDGRIRRDAIARICPLPSLAVIAENDMVIPITPEAIARKLVEAGLFEVNGEHYIVHDHLDYQLSEEIC